MTVALNAIFLHRDPQQALRLKRFYLAVAAYVMNAGVVAMCSWMGYFTMSVVLNYVALVLLINVVIFALLRSGASRRFADPSLTFAQMAVSTVSGFYVMYYASDLRAVFLLLALAMCIFGMFRFKTRDFVYMSALILAEYALVIVLLYWFRPDQVKVRLEVMQWMAMAVTLSQFSFMAGYIGNLRRKVRENNLKLAEQNVQLEAALQRISDMAVRDELTGTYNRRYLMERINEEVQRCTRNGSVFCICILDIDFFKKVNDTYGHVAGDAVLRAVAAAVGGSLRQTDFFGRFGGEEFLMVMSDTSVQGALVCAERVRSRVESLQFPEISAELAVSISIGIAEHLRNDDPTTTLNKADAALYLAKESGRNQCQLAAA